MMTHSYDLLDVGDGDHNAAYTTVGIISVPGDSGDGILPTRGGGGLTAIQPQNRGNSPLHGTPPTLFFFPRRSQKSSLVK